MRLKLGAVVYGTAIARGSCVFPALGGRARKSGGWRHNERTTAMDGPSSSRKGNGGGDGDSNACWNSNEMAYSAAPSETVPEAPSSSSMRAWRTSLAAPQLSSARIDSCLLGPHALHPAAMPIAPVSHPHVTASCMSSAHPRLRSWRQDIIRTSTTTHHD
jgi:hypothetical protein